MLYGIVRRRMMERPHFDIVASGARMRAIRQERKISVKQVMEYMLSLIHISEPTRH